MGCISVNDSNNNDKRFESIGPDPGEEYVHYLSKTKSEWCLVLYNLKDEAFTTLRIKENEISKDCESITINDKIYCTGGTSKSNKASSAVCVISFQRKVANIRHLSSLIHSRYKHSLVSLTIDSLLVMGGIKDKTIEVLECEAYNTLSNKWTNMGKLNYPRIESAACCFNNKMVYIFGGQKLSTNGHFIECMKVDNKTHIWKVLEVKVPESYLNSKRLWCTEINSTEIIIFWKEVIITFNTKSYKLTQDENTNHTILPDKREEIRKYGDEVVMISEATGNVTTYSLETKRWNIKPHIILPFE